ncbi:MAG: glycosyltransferase family 39 protein [Synechococcaceae cyanobacterium RM1_1_27]|nr:glycosyltransferase family 39 protein [Synechococcaceae cyanobacterium RM1_1_27]
MQPIKMSQPGSQRHSFWIWGWLGLISYLALFWHLGAVGLVDETEPIFAETSRQMWITGDWITPTFNGLERFDKPPLIYWLQATAYYLLGLNEWAVRIPSAIAALVQVVFGAATLLRFGGSRGHQENLTQPPWGLSRAWWAALLGGTLLATTPLTLVWGRTGVSDMVLVACVSGAMWAFFWAYAGSGRHWYLVFYTLLGLGILAKGPVALVLPGLSLGLFLLWLGRDHALKVMREMGLIAGTVVVLVITLPWYVAVIGRHGWAYVQDFFGYHNVARFTQVVNNHSAPWYFYGLVVLVGFLPYSVHLPLVMARLRFWQRQRWRGIPRDQHLGLFALCWFGAVFGFFSMAVTKLPSYLLPLMPAAAMLVALEWSRQLTAVPDLSQSHHRIPWPDWITGILNAAFLAVLAGLGWQLPRLLGPDDAAPDLTAAIQTFHLPTGSLVGWGLAFGLAVVLLGLRQVRWLWTANVLGSLGLVVLLFSSAIFALNDARQVPLRELALELRADTSEAQQDPVLMVGVFKPSLVFYSQRTIIPVPDPGQLSQVLQDLAATTEPFTGAWVVGLKQDLVLAQLSLDEGQDFDPYGLVRIEDP